MKTLVNFCMKFKLPLLSVGLLALALMVTHFVAASAQTGFVDHLSDLNQRIQRHHILIGLTHALIIVSIYYLWGMKVDYEAKKKHLLPATVKKAKRFRYYLIFFVLLVDYFTFWH